MQYKILIILFLMVNNLFAAQKLITFSIPLNKEQPMYKAMHQIYSEAFSEIGIKFQSISCVPYNCSHLLSRGEVDGEPSRIEAYTNYYPNIIKVDVPVFQHNLVIITRRQEKTYHTIKMLMDSDALIAYTKDYLIFRELFKDLDDFRVKRVIHWSEGLDLLGRKAIDVYITGLQWEFPKIKNIIDSTFTSTVPTDDLGRFNTYPFINLKQKTIAKPLAKSLTKMKKSGRIISILKQHGIPTIFAAPIKEN